MEIREVRRGREREDNMYIEARCYYRIFTLLDTFRYKRIFAV